jgi:hypothetical protein
VNEHQHIMPAYSSKLDELLHRIEGVECATQVAVRFDDQEWFHWLQCRHDELKRQLAKEQ